MLDDLTTWTTADKNTNLTELCPGRENKISGHWEMALKSRSSPGKSVDKYTLYKSQTFWPSLNSIRSGLCGALS